MAVSAAFTLLCDVGPSVILTLVVLRCVCWVWRWFRPIATLGAGLVAELDVGPDWSTIGVTTPYQRELAYMFKAEYGELRYNKANRIIASSWCLRAMAEADVRYVDRVKLLPLAIELCLLPTSAAVFAAGLSATPEVVARRLAADCVK